MSNPACKKCYDEIAAESEALFIRGARVHEGSVDIVHEKRARGVDVRVEIRHHAGNESPHEKPERPFRDEPRDDQRKHLIGVPVRCGRAELAGEKTDGEKSGQDEQYREDELDDRAKNVGRARVSSASRPERTLDDRLISDPISWAEHEAETKNDSRPRIVGMRRRRQ